ncbi:MAG TPA: ribonuclease Y, partial [Candidatus Kapabacteria bacterium]|nr:ribonuclease Y [Candidatus Kapabacteria bacterium]
MSLVAIIVGILGIALGIGIGYYLRKQLAQAKANSIEATADKILIEAKNKEQDILLQAKEKSIKIIDDAKQEEEQRRNEQRQIQARLEKREAMFDQKLLEFEQEKSQLMEKKEQLQAIKQKIEDLQQQALKKLEDVAGYTRDQAKEELFKKIEDQSKDDLMHRVIKLDQDSSEVLENKAQEIIINAMQRTAANHAAETTATAITLPSDDMKGRIIGKEGRNIKTLEKMTGCELVIDETPDLILISSFSPIRRRVCQLALEKLMKDGRIQPTKIEEYVEEAKKELALDIRKTGDEALHKIGIPGIDPKLVSIVGRLKYRTSYGQNVLNHCLEVGYLASIIAEEVGFDPAKAKKAGFFHDIGKAMDHETQGSHMEIGYNILKKFGVDDDTCQVALTHHETNPPLLLTKIVMAADAISASRVGARRDTFEQYVARLEELENTA